MLLSMRLSKYLVLTVYDILYQEGKSNLAIRKHVRLMVLFGSQIWYYDWSSLI